MHNQLVEVLHYIESILDSGTQTDMIFIDMSKAFDKVSHTALINKLRQYKIGGPLLQWFASYLVEAPRCSQIGSFGRDGWLQKLMIHCQKTTLITKKRNQGKIKKAMRR